MRLRPGCGLASGHDLLCPGIAERQPRTRPLSLAVADRRAHAGRLLRILSLRRSDFSVALPLIADELAARGLAPDFVRIRLTATRKFRTLSDGAHRASRAEGRCFEYPDSGVQLAAGKRAVFSLQHINKEV